MLSAIEKLELCRQACRLADNPRFDGGSVRLSLSPSEENKNLVRSLIEGELCYPNSAFLQNSSAALLPLELILPRGLDCFFASTLGDLLASQVEASVRAPTCVYFADVDTMCGPETILESGQIKDYYDALRAVELLRCGADYEDRSTGYLKLVFLQREKVEVTVAMNASDLLPIENGERWLALLSEDLHKEQRRAIFRKLISDALKDVELGRRLAKYIVQFDDLYRRFIDNYELYIAEFSFEKFAQDAEDKKFDYVVKIGRTFSDIQNQILAIPVAVVIAGGQMEKASGVSLKNTVVLIGMYVFALLMAMLIRNQLSTLASLGDELCVQKQQLEKKTKFWSPRLTAMYSDLDTRLARQRLLLWIVDGLVAGSIAVSTLLYVHVSGAL